MPTSTLYYRDEPMKRQHRCLPRSYEETSRDYNRVFQRISCRDADCAFYQHSSYAEQVRRAISQVHAAEAEMYFDVVY